MRINENIFSSSFVQDCSIIKFPESSLCVALILKSSPCLIKIRVPLLCEVPCAKNESPLQALFFPLFFNLVTAISFLKETYIYILFTQPFSFIESANTSNV